MAHVTPVRSLSAEPDGSGNSAETGGRHHIRHTELLCSPSANGLVAAVCSSGVDQYPTVPTTSAPPSCAEHHGVLAKAAFRCCAHAFPHPVVLPDDPGRLRNDRGRHHQTHRGQ
jgi:hypothetical protein